MDKPKILFSKSVYRASFFDVFETKVVFPGAIKRTHYNAVLQSVAAVFPVTKEREIYFVSQYRYLIGQETLEAVSGIVEKNETPLNAAKRELKEETGIEAGQWELLRKVELIPSFFRVPVSIFLAKELELKQSEPDKTEAIQIIKLPLFEAVEKIYTCEINTPTTIIGILLLDRLRKQKLI